MWNYRETWRKTWGTIGVPTGKIEETTPTFLPKSPTSPAQKMKFSIKDFFSKRDQTHRELRIWSHLLKKSLKKNFIFCFYNQNILCVRKIETHLTFTASCESFSIKDKTPSSITTNESENFFPACAKIHF